MHKDQPSIEGVHLTEDSSGTDGVFTVSASRPLSVSVAPGPRGVGVMSGTIPVPVKVAADGRETATVSREARMLGLAYAIEW